MPYAGDATVEPMGSDRCRVTMGAWSWPAVVAAILRFDTTVDVVGPRELAEAFQVVAVRAAAAAVRSTRGAG